MSARVVGAITPDVEVLKAEWKAETAIVLAKVPKTITITSREDADIAGLYREELKAGKNRWLERLDPMCAGANALHKSLTGLRADVVKPYDERLAVIDAELSLFATRERRRIAAQEEERAKAIRAAAEEEAKKRLPCEVPADAPCAQETQGGFHADPFAVGTRPMPAGLELAPGTPGPVSITTHHETPEQIRASSIVVPAKAEPLKVAGVRLTPKWRWELVDRDKVWPSFMEPDARKIGAAVKEHGPGAEAVVGGIRVWEDTTVGGRG